MYGSFPVVQMYMVTIVSFLFILICSVLVTKVATIALVHTGLSRQSARFQATSAFTGAGFTTREAEDIVNHPVRRRVVLYLMILGKAGLVTIISSFLLTFVREDTSEGLALWQRLSILAAGILILWFLFSSTAFDRWLTKVINYLLQKYTSLRIKDYDAIMHLSGDYEIAEMSVDKNNWMAEKTLAELGLRHEGISIIGITRKGGKFIGAPGGAVCIHAGDSLVLYGRADAIKDLDLRKNDVRGKLAHEESVVENQKLQEKIVKDESQSAGKPPTRNREAAKR